MKVVSNSSALIGLSSIGKLSLLRERFQGGILIPTAVWREVVDEGAGRPGAREVSSANWIRVQNVEDRQIVRLLQGELDEGEAEAIALARQVNAKLILLDELNARRIAQRMNHYILGTIGILAWAKTTGKIDSLWEQLTALREQGKFRISQTLFERVLREAGELGNQ